MEIILKEDIIGLGYKNDIVNVKSGYGRNGVALVIKAKVSATGVTYGSVNAATVAEELKKRGIEIDRKIITMRDIKKVGDFEAVVHFHKDVEVILPVKVVAENVVVETPEGEAPVAETLKEEVEEVSAAE